MWGGGGLGLDFDLGIVGSVLNKGSGFRADVVLEDGASVRVLAGVCVRECLENDGYCVIWSKAVGIQFSSLVRVLQCGKLRALRCLLSLLLC